MENELNLKGSFVNGKWFNEGKSLAIINPATGQVLSEVKIVPKNILDLAITGAKKAQKNCEEVFILPETNNITSAILYSIPIQLIAYHLGSALGTDIDQPRNLAKSVTVE